MLMDRYETTFGIRNHDAEIGEDAQHPFGVILFNEKEDVISGGAMYERMVAYHDKNIREHFGLSFNEFIDQPSWRVELMLKLATGWVRKATASAEAALNQLNAGSDKPPKQQIKNQ